MVDIQGTDGRSLARGLVECSSEEIELLKDQQTDGKNDAIIHRDNMVIL